MPSSQIRYARSEGLDIAYQMVGDGPIDVVVVPGFVSNLELIWDTPAFGPILNHIARYARCAVFDKRGTGLSDRDPGFGSLESRADDIRAVMDHAGIERAALFGFSEGGPLSVVFAAAYPERATALAIYGSTPRFLEAPGYPAGFSEAALGSFRDLIAGEWGTGRAMPRFIQQMPDTESVRSMAARFERMSATPRGVARILELAFDIDVRDLCRSISCPTLILHSSGDRVVAPAQGKVLADLIPDARHVEEAAEYHMVWDPDGPWYLDELQAFLTADHPEALPTERVLATVLFTDIVGSTETAGRKGDRAWRSMLDLHDRMAADSVTRFGGDVVKTTGDGLLALFDRPSRGIAAARAVGESVAGIGLDIRAGLHTGEVERRGADVGGMGVHIAARIMGLAGPGEVWASRTVRDLTVGSGIEFSARGRHPLKGVADEWELFSLAS